jgi:transposase
VAETCRHYGISREIFYQWRRRYQADWLPGLQDRPQGPHHCPRATPPEIVEKVLYLRQHYHTGPRRIRMYLLRYHEIVIADQTMYRILRRPGRLRTLQRRHRVLEGKKLLDSSHFTLRFQFYSWRACTLRSERSGGTAHDCAGAWV